MFFELKLVHSVAGFFLRRKRTQWLITRTRGVPETSARTMSGPRPDISGYPELSGPGPDNSGYPEISGPYQVPVLIFPDTRNYQDRGPDNSGYPEISGPYQVLSGPDPDSSGYPELSGLVQEISGRHQDRFLVQESIRTPSGRIRTRS